MDSRIALGINPLVVPDQAESLRKAMTLQALQGQSQLQGLQLEEGQRTLGQNRAMDEAARGSTSTEEYLTRLAKINPAAAIKMKGDLLGSQKAQGEVYEQQSKAAQGLTAGFMSVPDAQKPQAYMQFAAEWKRMNLPNADKVPDQFSPELIPHLTMIASRGLAPKDVKEDADYKPKGASPVVAALGGQPPMPVQPQDAVDPTSGATVRALTGEQPQGVPIGQNAPPPAAGDPVMPPNTVTPKESDLLRDKARLLEEEGGKVNYDKAQNLYKRADGMDEREFKQRGLEADQWSSTSIPGVSFNKKKNEYSMDGKPVTAKQQQDIEASLKKAGATSLQIGDSALGLGKAAMTKVDEGLLDTTARIGRLSQIQNEYKPEYQEVGTRLSNAWTGLKNKLGVGVSGSDRSKLEDFSTYKRKAIDNVNQHIKESTGATMGVQEAGRLMQAIPNPGTSWYDGDSPIEFKSKMDDTIRNLKLAEARLVYIKRNGMSTNAEDLGKQVPLEKMPQIMNQRGAELEGIAKQRYQNMGPDELRKSVKRQLAQEFGLTAD